MPIAVSQINLSSDAAVSNFIKNSNLNLSSSPIDLAADILKEFSKFPYENLSKIIRLNQDFGGSPFRSPDEIFEDYYKYSLGGTCFSLTNFLQNIMDYFDFDTHIIMADMRSGENTHCALVLSHHGDDFLMDPGYLMQSPLRLVERDNLIQPMDGVFLQWSDSTESFTLFTIKNGNPTFRYRFTNKPTPRHEFLKHWQRSFHWMTMHGICLSKKDENGMIYMHNNYLKMDRKDKQHKGVLKDPIEVIAKTYFNVPDEITQKARKALEENLHNDKELGHRVPRWVE